MKYKLLLYFILFAALASKAQVSSLHENFDVTCVTASLPSSHGWQVYNPITGSTAATPGNWTCTATDGRGGTPGMQCSGVYSGAYNMDTSYLITPLLYFYGSVTGSYYLTFDTKTDSLTLGGELTVLYSDSSGRHFSLDMLDSLTPAFSIADSTGWVTHEVNITKFEDTLRPFYLTFRYISSDTTGSLWFLDNINTSSVSITLNTPEIIKDKLPLAVIGCSTPNQLSLSYSVPITGLYHLSMYDILGREVYKEDLNLQQGKDIYTINGLGLKDGMYLIKMDNSQMYGITKIIIQ
jgi:hypothetical protein